MQFSYIIGSLMNPQILDILYSVIKLFLVLFPGLVAGFLLSGLLHEIIPDIWIQQNVGKRGLRPILYAAVSGAILPLCAWAELPMAISFYKKGARLGPFLAFLLTAPATSFVALILTFQILGFRYCLYVFFSVIIMGTIVGLVGNLLEKESPSRESNEKHTRFANLLFSVARQRSQKKTLRVRLRLALKYAFVDMAREIGPSILLGILISALIEHLDFLHLWLISTLRGWFAYLFAVASSLLLYVTAPAAIFIAKALLTQGIGKGAAMTFLLMSPVTSFGTILVLRKEFGGKILFAYLSTMSVAAVILGYAFSLL